MAKVVITISDEEPGQELAIGMEFSPAVKTTPDAERFQAENPITHIAAYLAWAAIDNYVGGGGEVQSVSADNNGIVI